MIAPCFVYTEFIALQSCTYMRSWFFVFCCVLFIFYDLVIFLLFKAALQLDDINVFWEPSGDII